MDGGGWQTSTRFDGLSPNILYQFEARKAETETHFVSPVGPAAAFSTLPLGITENEFADIQVYSHQNIINIKNESNISLKSVEVLDMTGRLVYQNTITDVETVITLYVPIGIYNVKLILQDGRMVTRKVLIL